VTSTDLLPALDCHAHIAVDVTSRQIGALGNAVVFAVTRSLAEAKQAATRRDDTLLWGIGLHPGVAVSRNSWSAGVFEEILPAFALVGEIGLDRRAGNLPEQRTIFGEVLDLCAGQPLLLSIHSAGMEKEVLERLGEQAHSGAILHWFQGDETAIGRAVELGLYFSVNAGMAPEQLARFPKDRVLSETDYPARKPRARKPADVAAIEELLSIVWGVEPNAVRTHLWWNLRRLSEASGAIERMPEQLADTLLYL
jgi:TatD DNase family protein